MVMYINHASSLYPINNDTELDFLTTNIDMLNSCFGIKFNSSSHKICVVLY